MCQSHITETDMKRARAFRARAPHECRSGGSMQQILYSATTRDACVKYDGDTRSGHGGVWSKMLCVGVLQEVWKYQGHKGKCYRKQKQCAWKLGEVTSLNCWAVSWFMFSTVTWVVMSGRRQWQKDNPGSHFAGSHTSHLRVWIYLRKWSHQRILSKGVTKANLCFGKIILATI